MLSPQIAEVIEQLQAGDKAAARKRLLEMWAAASGEGAAMDRCIIAHFLADTEEDIDRELDWDLRALAAAADASRKRGPGEASLEVDRFMPSLHLNVGDAYRRRGDLENARIHAELGMSCCSALEDDGYGQMIKGGLGRLQTTLQHAR